MPDLKLTHIGKAIAWAARGSTLAAQNAAHQTGADRAILFLAGVIAHTLTHHLRMYIVSRTIVPRSLTATSPTSIRIWGSLPQLLKLWPPMGETCRHIRREEKMGGRTTHASGVARWCQSIDPYTAYVVFVPDSRTAD